MTDEQWSDLTHRLKLPDAARAPIENELDLYARVAAAGTAPPPTATRKKLEQTAALTCELLKTIDEFGPEEHDALSASQPVIVGPASNTAELAGLVGRPRATRRLDTLKFLAEQHAHLTALRDRMATGATTVGRGKTGRDASNVRALVGRVSKIIDACTGGPLSKGKREFDFALELCKLADPQISPGSVKGAIESLLEKLAPENSANSG